MFIADIIRKNRKAILEIATRYGAMNVRLFGSMVRGTSHSSSDVDLLVSMKPGSSLLDIIAIKQDLEDLLGKKVDVVTENSISPYIKDAVLKEAVTL